MKVTLYMYIGPPSTDPLKVSGEERSTKVPVGTMNLPPFKTQPDVIIWEGNRFFVPMDTTGDYREAFVYPDPRLAIG